MTDTPGAVPAPAKTNTLAIIALVVAIFCFPLVGAILGFVAKNQIKQSGEGGDGIATAAIVVGLLFTVLYALYFVL
jgi:hypothetical protein